MQLLLTAALVVAGPSSVFGGPCDGQDNDVSAFGLSTNQPIIAMYRRDTAGDSFLLRTPNRRQVVVVHGDYGPAPWTGKVLDVGWLAAAATGYGSPCPAYPTGAWARATPLTRRQVCPAVMRTRTRYDNRAHPRCRYEDRARARPVRR